MLFLNYLLESTSIFRSAEVPVTVIVYRCHRYVPEVFSRVLKIDGTVLFGDARAGWLVRQTTGVLRTREERRDAGHSLASSSVFHKKKMLGRAANPVSARE